MLVLRLVIFIDLYIISFDTQLSSLTSGWAPSHASAEGPGDDDSAAVRDALPRGVSDGRED
jgi:hypothetical protein